MKEKAYDTIIWSYKEYSKTTGLLMHYFNIDIIGVERTGYSFVDSYLYDLDQPRDKESIYLRFRPIETRIGSESMLLAMYKAKDYYYLDEDIIIVLPIAKKFYKDVENFKEGKYSKLDLKRVEKIFGDEDLRYHVCAKSSILKERIEEELGTTISDDLELGPMPDPTREILNYDVSRVSESGWPDRNLPK